jgi:type II secretory pathway predicted ATPase ExeA
MSRKHHLIRGLIRIHNKKRTRGTLQLAVERKKSNAMQQPMTTYQDFYRLQEAPFANLTASPAPFFGAGQQSVIDAMQHGMAARRGIITLIGEAGLGKTTLVRAILAQLASSPLTSIYVEQPDLDSDALAAHIAQALGQTCPDALRSEGLRCLLSLLEQAAVGEHRIVLVVDNAHLMPMATLRQMGQLAIYAAAFVQVILIGQTVLADTCQRAGLDEHTMAIPLNPLTLAESAAYIRQRLADASSGQQADIFSAGAIKAIVKYASGVPRDLNMVCTDVLRAGFAKRENPISAKTAQSVIAEFTGSMPSRRLPLAWAGALAACALIGWVSLSPILTSDRAGTIPAVAAVRQDSSPVPSLPDTTVIKLSMPQQESEVAAPIPESPKPESPQMVQSAIAPSKMVPHEPPTPSSDGAFAQLESILQAAFPAGGDFHLQVRAQKASGAPYEEGEALGVSLQASTAAYLRIDYVQADGRVIHLLPSPLSLNQVEADKPFVFGTPDSSLPLAIAPPFGEEMLIVIASQQAIPVQADAGPAEPADQYVSRLAYDLQRIKAQGKAAVAALRLHTQSRGERRWSRVAQP